MARAWLSGAAVAVFTDPVANKTQTTNSRTTRLALRLGFVPLTDCAPLIMAQELGLFQKYGLRVALHRELGWATIRDKIVHGELEAAHALAPMLLAATLGLGSVPCECVTGLVLNLHGNAITLSQALWAQGIRDGITLRQEMVRVRREKPLTFGVVARFSSHHFLLRKWLADSGLRPDKDVRIVVVPPPQMAANLKAGHLDGFCAGEPWNSVAARAGIGWCVAASAELSPGHPEKVLMARREFTEKRGEENVALIAALLEACCYCDEPQNNECLVDILARPQYVGVPAAALLPGIRGELNFGGGAVRSVRDFTIFHRDNANEPTAARGAWVHHQMREILPPSDAASLTPALVRRVFSQELFERASELRESGPSEEPKTHRPEFSLCVK